MIEIGNLKLKGAALGPMAGVTDRCFRVLCREKGAGLLYTEMVSAKGILYNNRNTEELISVTEYERPIALQLFGSDPEILAHAVEKINDRDFDILDINMGCPVAKVVSNGEGSALMKDPKLVERIVKAVCDVSSKPVSVKIRKGYGKNDDTAVPCALAAECGGASLIAVHGRTRADFYSGKADWNVIKRVKDAVKIPVIGNGDIFTPDDAKRMTEETGCDGVMVARGAQGNPWIFERINAYLERGELIPEPTAYEKIEMALRHARMEIEMRGEYTAIREMRKHVTWYATGFPGAPKLRDKVNSAETYADLENLFKFHLK